ncbi:IS200/IS605 family accessory protein TnpB-related protein [Heliomicrobium modesticaldum]|uniref:IS200/IS605 family accessory protein TnpB-related protein n=1 Tax=Heliomicrobium modesticaldum TaxID=35701 RepID=UPI0003060288|nr:IS200/IS605 family accessory protein TnpB-related protein [Heliomicrobium modesticaldum]
MKITARGEILALSDEAKTAVDDLMRIFSSAIRYSFQRLIEGSMSVGDIEKDVAFRYGLNIRQAKDAVEDARQTLISQRKLLPEYVKNYAKKAEAVEKKLKHVKSEKKRKALLSKLAKRQRKRDYYQQFITANTIPPVVFGGKKTFHQRCAGTISIEKWRDKRSNRVYARGDKTKKGNPNLRILYHDEKLFLEISTLAKTPSGRSVKVTVPLYIAQKKSKKTGRVNGRNYRQMLIDYLHTGDAYQVEILRRKGRYYVHVTFDEAAVRAYKVEYKGHAGLVGIDTNPDGFALTHIDRTGNYRHHTAIARHELTYARSNRRENLIGEMVKEVIQYAKDRQCGVAFEDLKFEHDQDSQRKFSRIRHNFIYRQMLTMLERACIRNGIEYTKVKPAFTSKIGLYKYTHQYGLDVHHGAALVIARRAYGMKEKVPRLLREKLLPTKSPSTEWKRWAMIHQRIEKEAKIITKGSVTPEFWRSHRKEILGLT